MANALAQTREIRQLAFNERWMTQRGLASAGRPVQGLSKGAVLCAGCRAKEARYGFREAGEVQVDQAGELHTRPRTLCFGCFRVEMDRRRAVAAQLARGWNARQVRLPLDETLRRLTTRRRRAQIAARHALGG